MFEQNSEYKKYLSGKTNEELYDIERHLDKDKFKSKYKILQEELRNREIKNDKIIKVTQQTGNVDSFEEINLSEKHEVVLFLIFYICLEIWDYRLIEYFPEQKTFIYPAFYLFVCWLSFYIAYKYWSSTNKPDSLSVMLGPILFLSLFLASLSSDQSTIREFFDAIGLF